MKASYLHSAHLCVKEKPALAMEQRTLTVRSEINGRLFYLLTSSGPSKPLIIDVDFFGSAWNDILELFKFAFSGMQLVCFIFWITTGSPGCRGNSLDGYGRHIYRPIEQV
ncbi:hypothetical protein CEXT_752151 [Caerostris extrusa]|uniref:Uncharacterized protein n=1 Tax=Caerostris extrusa TaxID=172846 RepID=A0AAV4QR26_CAEEX|nr:hypothetical protein CEXT_752151 [Caerostris extrusa]